MSYNPNDYEEVKDRIRRFYADHPDGRIITHNLTTPEDRAALTWVVKAEIWLPVWDVENENFLFEEPWFLKSTGLAFEIDGKNGLANKTSALENCETSAIGRALANANYGGDKRVTREEMAKVARGLTPSRDWVKEAQNATSLDQLRKLYSEARQAGVDDATLATITEWAESWTNKGKQS
jgi:hypothetical protein